MTMNIPVLRAQAGNIPIAISLQEEPGIRDTYGYRTARTAETPKKCTSPPLGNAKSAKFSVHHFGQKLLCAVAQPKNAFV